MSNKEFQQLYLNEDYNIKEEIHEILANIDYVVGEYGVYAGSHHSKLYVSIEKGKNYKEACLELSTLLPKAEIYLQVRIHFKERKFKYCVAKQCCKC